MKTETYGKAQADIRIAPELSFGLSCIVANTSISAGADGKKIIKAGTPLYCTADVRVERDTEMTTTYVASGGSGVQNKCYGVAMHDIDVTDGNTNATLLIAGFVDIDMLDTTTAALITETVKSAIPAIQFIKGDA